MSKVDEIAAWDFHTDMCLLARDIRRVRRVCHAPQFPIYRKYKIYIHQSLAHPKFTDTYIAHVMIVTMADPPISLLTELKNVPLRATRYRGRCRTCV